MQLYLAKDVTKPKHSQTRLRNIFPSLRLHRSQCSSTPGNSTTQCLFRAFCMLLQQGAIPWVVGLIHYPMSQFKWWQSGRETCSPLFFSADWCCQHCMHLQIDKKALADFCGQADGKPRDIQEFSALFTRKKIQVPLAQHKCTNLGCHNFWGEKTDTFG